MTEAQIAELLGTAEWAAIGLWFLAVAVFFNALMRDLK